MSPVITCTAAPRAAARRANTTLAANRVSQSTLYSDTAVAGGSTAAKSARAPTGNNAEAVNPAFRNSLRLVIPSLGSDSNCAPNHTLRRLPESTLRLRPLVPLTRRDRLTSPRFRTFEESALPIRGERTHDTTLP